MALGDGYALIERDYDADGNVTPERYFDGAGEPVLRKQGYASVEKEYNECRKYVDIYDKIEISNEDMRKLENR